MYFDYNTVGRTIPSIHDLSGIFTSGHSPPYIVLAIGIMEKVVMKSNYIYMYPHNVNSQELLPYDLCQIQQEWPLPIEESIYSLLSIQNVQQTMGECVIAIGAIGTEVS